MQLNLTAQQSEYYCSSACVSSILYLCIIVVIYYQSYHIIGGMPQGGGGSGSCLLTDQHKISKYSTALHIPLWAAYRLDRNVCGCVHVHLME